MPLKEVSSSIQINVIFYQNRCVSISLVKPLSCREALALEGKINSSGKPMDFSKPHCCAGFLIGLFYGFSWMRGCKLIAPSC